MSINGALQVGRSALTASQVALQVAGNNMANAATPGFHRQSIHLTPLRGEFAQQGAFVGRGVRIMSIRREVDTAIQARLRNATSDEHAALIDQRFLTSIETLQNELTGNDVSSLLSEFFNAFSEVANNPEDDAVRTVAIQEGVNLASRLSDLRQGYTETRAEIDRSLGDAVNEVNRLLDDIAALIGDIALSEASGGEMAALRDQRDILIDQLSEYADISVVEQDSGSADIFIGSIPVVLAADSRGIRFDKTNEGGETSAHVRVDSDGTYLEINSGRIGALMRQRTETIDPAIEAVDEFANQLIYQVNRLHSQGQGRHGYASVVGAQRVDDVNANLNAAAADLPFRIDNGSFLISVTNAESGLRESVQVNVDGDAMSLQDLVDSINATVPNVTASITAGNALQLEAAAGHELSFSDDSSGALAALGVNTFFTGDDATNIDVNQILLDDSSMLAVGLGHIGGSNGTALALADLQDQSISGLGDRSLRDFWQSNVNELASRTAAANQRVQAAGLVRESLAAQAQSVSGVSLDEESINLLTYQRQFQAAARFISVIDETLQTLLSIS